MTLPPRPSANKALTPLLGKVRHLRAWPLTLRVLCAAAIASLAGVAGIALATRGAECRLEQLAAEDVASFRAHLDHCLGRIPQPDPTAPANLLESTNESANFSALQGALGIDSVLLVPGFVALLVCISLAFWPTFRSQSLRPRDIGEQCLLALIVAAGLFDWLENGLTLHALFRHRAGTLHDGIIADSLTISRIKWTLLGLVTLLIAVVAGTLTPLKRPIPALLGGLAGLGVMFAPLLTNVPTSAPTLALAIAWTSFVISALRQGVAA